MSHKIKRIKNKIPEIKKEINDFLLNDEGKISKKTVVKLGITLAVLAMAVTPQGANADTVTTHTDDFPGGPGIGVSGHNSSYASNSHTSWLDHSNYFVTTHTSHSSHCSCDWM